MRDLGAGLGAAGVAVAVSDREDGFLGFAGAPDPGAVAEARRAFLTRAGADPAAAVAARQVHGTAILPVGPADRGRGGLAPDGTRREGDGLVTAEEGLPLLVLGADCAVVALAAGDGRGVAAFHAGWRGAAAGTPAAAVAALRAAGVAPAEMRAVAGPAIGPCCCEVGPEVEAAFLRSFGERARAWFLPGRRGRPHLDLPGAVRDALAAAGVPEAAIAGPGPCTRCDARWFSHRRGDRGRHALAVWRS